MKAGVKLAKYGAVGLVTVRNHLAYVSDFAIRSLFLLLILYIFVQLWRVTFAGEGAGRIAGYSFEQIIWYLIVSESVILSSPRITWKVETEVKNGDVGYQLIRPMSYLLYQYAGYMGEAAVRVAVNLAIGCALGIALFGLQAPGWNVPACLLMLIGSFTVNFLMNMMLALCAFWVEETRGLDFLYQKLLFTVGGMLLPLELFPDTLQAVCRWLPFQAVAYFSAKTAVQFDPSQFVRMLAVQWLWAGALVPPLIWVYAKGVKKLNVNGG